ncbi:MAG: ribosome silencing factor [Treponemataceae bacterium]|nr:MAG: ribosome silencing factor [Treponemataceae bacterium]
MKTTTEQMALEIADLLEDGKGGDVAALDVSCLNSWTDFFVIATIASPTHHKSLYKLVKDYCRDSNGVLEIRAPAKKIPDGDDWVLIDLGVIVVHLMSKDAREFYDLEKLWHNGRKIRGADCGNAD